MVPLGLTTAATGQSDPTTGVSVTVSSQTVRYPDTREVVYTIHFAPADADRTVGVLMVEPDWLFAETVLGDPGVTVAGEGSARAPYTCQASSPTYQAARIVLPAHTPGQVRFRYRADVIPAPRGATGAGHAAITTQGVTRQVAAPVLRPAGRRAQTVSSRTRPALRTAEQATVPARMTQLNPGRPLTITGQLAPRRPGVRVILTDHSFDGFALSASRFIARTRADRHGRYRFATRARPGVHALAVAAAGSPNLAAGRSCPRVYQGR